MGQTCLASGNRRAKRERDGLRSFTFSFTIPGIDLPAVEYRRYASTKRERKRLNEEKIIYLNCNATTSIKFSWTEPVAVSSVCNRSLVPWGGAMTASHKNTQGELL